MLGLKVIQKFDETFNELCETLFDKHYEEEEVYEKEKKEEVLLHEMFGHDGWHVELVP